MKNRIEIPGVSINLKWFIILFILFIGEPDLLDVVIELIQSLAAGLQ